MKKILLLIMLILLSSITTATTVYDFLSNIDPANTLVVHNDNEELWIIDEIIEFSENFNLVDIYDESQFELQENKNYIVIGTYLNYDRLKNTFYSETWLYEDIADAFVQLDHTMLGGNIVYITGEGFKATAAVINAVESFMDNAIAYQSEIVLFNNGTPKQTYTSCTEDTDNGDIYVKGMLLPDNTYDECKTSNLLIEYTCDYGMYTIEEVECVCIDGACKYTAQKIFETIEKTLDPIQILYIINNWLS